MPFDGNGTYDLPSPAYPAVSDTEIFAADRNDIDSDLAVALSNCITRDGQSPALANLPMGGSKITGLGDGTLATDAINLGQIQNRTWTGVQNFTGATVTVATQVSGDSSTKVASTAFVAAAAFNAALPVQSGATSRKVPVSDGTNAAWELVLLTDMVSGILPQANGGTGTASATGTGAAVYAVGASLTDPIFVSPSLGTPDSGVVTNLTGTAPSVVAGKATTLETPRNIDGQSFDGSANITVIAPGTNAAASKATPVDADEIPLVDSAASNVLKKLTWANLKATAKTYFDTLYAGKGANNDITTMTALIAGGLPNSSVLTADIANGNITAAKLDSGQSGAMPIAGIRASVTFAVSGGACTIQHGINVGSVTYLGTGQYRVNFTTSMGSTNYGMVATCLALGGAFNQTLIACYGGSSARTATTCEMYTTTGWADGVVAAVLKDSPLVTAFFLG